jgi:hypothetical protein
MARGQAFETMMLVISVIVALAILGVLLSILGVFGGGIVGGDPKSTMKDNFRDLHSGGGIGVSAPKRVTFKAGTTVVPKELISSLPIQSKQIKFICANNDDICSDNPMKVDDAIITVSSDVEVTLVTCANEGSDNNQEANYYAAVSHANKPSEATDACMTEANLK